MSSSKAPALGHSGDAARAAYVWAEYEVVKGKGTPAQKIANNMIKPGNHKPRQAIILWLDPTSEDMLEALKMLNIHVAKIASTFPADPVAIDFVKKARSKLEAISKGETAKLGRKTLRQEFWEVCGDACKVYKLPM